MLSVYKCARPCVQRPEVGVRCLPCSPLPSSVGGSHWALNLLFWLDCLKRKSGGKLSWQADPQKEGVVAKKEEIDLWGWLVPAVWDLSHWDEHGRDLLHLFASVCSHSRDVKLPSLVLYDCTIWSLLALTDTPGSSSCPIAEVADLCCHAWLLHECWKPWVFT